MSEYAPRTPDEELHDVIDGYFQLICSPKITPRQARALHAATVLYRTFGCRADDLTTACRISAIRKAVEELMAELDEQRTIVQ